MSAGRWNDGWEVTTTKCLVSLGHSEQRGVSLEKQPLLQERGHGVKDSTRTMSSCRQRHQGLRGLGVFILDEFGFPTGYKARL